jgi:pyridoxamine 5'-phosphate oxidase
MKNRAIPPLPNRMGITNAGTVQDVKNLRRDYRTGELRRRDLAPDPFAQFDSWLQTAISCKEIREANAMTVATSGKDGRVTARTVLLKESNSTGFVFFTNYASLKALQIEENPHVALLFAWLPLERQISITGRASKSTREESLAYFSSRPVASRIAARSSHQSHPVPSREVLEKQFEDLRAEYPGDDIPLPEFWGGYRVIPQTIEFWQGRTSRLHDRFLYSRATDGSWQIERLSP